MPRIFGTVVLAVLAGGIWKMIFNGIGLPGEMLGIGAGFLFFWILLAIQSGSPQREV